MPSIQALPGAQETFLAVDTDVAIFAAPAQGGKTYALLLSPLDYASHQDYHAAIFSRERGAMWETSKGIYSIVGGRSSDDYKAWLFSGGMTLKIADLPIHDDCLSWQYTQLAMIGFDNLQQYPEATFWSMLTRNRTKCGAKPAMRATVNLDRPGWVGDMLEWYLDPDTGDPIRHRIGSKRWFTRYDGETVWGDSIEVVSRQFPTHVIVKSFTCIA